MTDVQLKDLVCSMMTYCIIQWDVKTKSHIISLYKEDMVPQLRRFDKLQEVKSPAVMAGMIGCLLFVVTFSMAVVSQARASQPDSYVAAVVEYAPVSGATLENKEQIFMENVANYISYMEQAARQSADIIVFPEVGLASMGVPQNPDGTPSLAFTVPFPGFTPCSDNSSEIAQGIRDLSCAAKKHGLYVVVNLPEKVPCSSDSTTQNATECPSTGAYYHNTNVVFDRRGTIISRYRKFNLYGEPGFVPTPTPEHAIFETDFGVRFGTFICFDIMFEEPAVVLARDYGVCDFTFPTAWFSEAPFLTAAQEQAAWSHALDVNLLAAGYNRPTVGSAGSGIYLGRNGVLKAVMPNVTTSRLLVGSVPKKQHCASPLRGARRESQLEDSDGSAAGAVAERHCQQGERRGADCPDLIHGAADSVSREGIYLKRDYLDVYKTLILSTRRGMQNETETVCDGTFCCQFTVAKETRGIGPHYVYRLAVFNGVRTFDGVTTGGIQVCSVIPCASDDMASCGRLTLPNEAEASTVFWRISIEGTFLNNHTLVTANTLQSGLLPLSADTFSLKSQQGDAGLSQVTMETAERVSTDGVSLLTFGIHSRVFERDGEPETTENTPSYFVV